MNKMIWALAFVVLCSGMAFAIGNATIDGTVSQSKYAGAETAENVTTEGGNVSTVNLTGTDSTERWAGAYGNVSGTLVLAEAGDTNYMYDWTYDTGDGGEVCVSVASNFDWTAPLTAASLTGLSTAWDFGDNADNVTETFDDGTQSFEIAGQTIPAVPLADTGGADYVTGALNDGAGSAQTDFAFCVNITGAGSNYDTETVDYEVIMPTDDAVDATETYFFYIELV